MPSASFTFFRSPSSFELVNPPTDGRRQACLGTVQMLLQIESRPSVSDADAVPGGEIAVGAGTELPRLDDLSYFEGTAVAPVGGNFKMNISA